MSTAKRGAARPNRMNFRNGSLEPLDILKKTSEHVEGMAVERLVSAAALDAALTAGAIYLDVRTPEEYALGHVPQSINLPYQVGDCAGLRPNVEFLDTAQRILDPRQSYVVGCHSGGRAAQAAAELAGLGLRVSVDPNGWAGAADAFGRRSPGWKSRNRPIETGAAPPRLSAPHDRDA